MKETFVLTLVGPDRTGLVDELADVVSKHGGNWEESRLVRLAGSFAGVVRVSISKDEVIAFEASLLKLSEVGLTVNFSPAGEDVSASGIEYGLEITGHDEAGILKKVSGVLSDLSVNVEELETNLESAAMAGHLMFKARGRILIGRDVEVTRLVEKLEEVGAGLTVDLRLL